MFKNYSSIGNVMKAQILTAMLLCASLSSCVDVGGALDNIGKKQAELRPTAHPMPEDPTKVYYDHERSTEVYRKDGRYYVRLDVVYCPSRTPLAMTPSGGWPSSCNLNNVPRAEEKSRMPSAVYYAVLTPRQYQLAQEPAPLLSRSPLSWQFYPVLPEDKVNLEGAERLKPERVRQLETLVESVPSERTWGNRLRYPLVLIGDVVDIPLNIICGPIGLVHIWATRLTP